MSEIRLQKYFTDCAVMSRRAAEAEISRGNVLVNGEPATLGMKIDPEHDRVEFRGRIIRPDTLSRTYILLNKPVGYVCTSSDEEGRQTVLDLLHGVKRRVYPVGRLDMYSDGLLILTDDGDLTCRLTHPSHGLTKTYVAAICGELTEDDVKRLSEPFEIDGYMIKRPGVRLISVSNGTSYVEFVLSEGRNRQIRRMCERAGVKITRLTRTKIGTVSDEALPLGHWRYLTDEEVQYLKTI